MSRLTVYPDHASDHAVLRTEDPALIADTLRPLVVRFERRDSPVRVSAADSSEAILDADRPTLDRMMGGTGAGTADVIRITPDTSNRDALRARFLSEHTHSEDEVRFFVSGRGSFILHVDGRVYDAHREAGDPISVPTGTGHGFDAGPEPEVCALRVFTDTTGRVAHYTGADIADRFPAR